MANASYPDLSIPIRNALINGRGITDNLSTFKGVEAVFTSRPTPSGADYPMIVVGPDLSPRDEGGLNDQQLVIMRDVGVYGQNAGEDKTQYRVVEATARLVRDLFHRKPNALKVPGWKVLQIWTTGPIEGPVSDDKFVSRIVALTITLISKTD